MPASIGISPVSVDEAIETVYGPVEAGIFNQIFDDNPGWTLEQVVRNFSEQVTTGQTDFFREKNLFRIAEGAMPLLERERPNQPVRILEIGSSTGEESYSLAAAILQRGYTNFTITAIDTNPRNLAVAQAAEYKLGYSWEYIAESGIDIPREFTEAGLIINSGKVWRRRSEYHELAVVSPSNSVKEKVTFQQHDILDGPVKNKYDLALINNVLMHYPNRSRDIIVRNVLASLRQGGVITLEWGMFHARPNEPDTMKSYDRWKSSFANRFGLELVNVPELQDQYHEFYNAPS